MLENDKSNLISFLQFLFTIDFITFTTGHSLNVYYLLLYSLTLSLFFFFPFSYWALLSNSADEQAIQFHMKI